MAQRRQLRRQILKWLQSLDLTYSVRNVRRDFANGFLVAESLSRYYPKLIQMHSYSNGMSMEARMDNWQQLSVILKKVEMDVDKATMRDIMRCDPDAAADFLEALFAFLTSREVVKYERKESEDAIPPFARDTASRVIKQHVRRPEMLEMTDLIEREKSIRTALSEHKQRLLQNRVSEEGAAYIADQTFSPILDGASSTRIGTSRVVSPNEGKISPIQVKSVEVKQFTLQRNSPQGFREFRSASGSLAEDRSSPSDESQKTLLDHLCASIDSHGSALLVREQDEQTKNSLVILEETVKLQSFPERVLETIFDEFLTVLLSDEGANLVRDCLNTRRQAWNILTVLPSLLEIVDQASRTFEIISDALVQFGVHAAASEPQSSILTFLDLCFPMLHTILKRQATKRHALLGILYAFSSPTATAHLKILKYLRRKFSNDGLFIQCLSILIFMENDFESASGRDLLERYIGFVKEGAESENDSTRAASIAMLSVIAQFEKGEVVALFPRMREARSWEEQIQTIIVLSNFVQQLDSKADAESLEEAILIILDGFSLRADADVQKIGLAYLGQSLGLDRRLSRQYVDVLLHLVKSGDAQTTRLLHERSQPEELSAPSSSGGVYALQPFPSTWDAPSVALALADTIEREGAKALETWHVDVLASAACYADMMSNTHAWEDVFDRVHKLLFVALCDEDACEQAVRAVRKFAIESSMGVQVIEAPSFLYSLKLLFSGSIVSDRPDKCATCVTAFLLSCFSDPRLAKGVEGVVQRFCLKFPELLETSDQLLELEKRVRF